MSLDGIAVVHTIPGRLRLRVDQVKGDPDFARRVQKRLSKVPGVKQVESKPLTGSVLIHYDTARILTEEAAMALTDGLAQLFPEIDTATLVNGIENLLMNLASGGPPPAARSVKQTLSGLNTRIAGLTGGLDFGLLVPSTLFFLGLRSLLTTKPRPFPSWYDYFWFAFNTFVILNLRGGQDKSDHPGPVPESGAPAENVTRH